MFRKFLENRKLQKCLLPAAFVCILPIWWILRQGAESVPAIAYVLGALGVLFFLLDRNLKPWDLERAEKREAEARRAEAERQAANADGRD